MLSLSAGLQSHTTALIRLYTADMQREWMFPYETVRAETVHFHSYKVMENKTIGASKFWYNFGAWQRSDFPEPPSSPGTDALTEIVWPHRVQRLQFSCHNPTTYRSQYCCQHEAVRGDDERSPSSGLQWMSLIIVPCRSVPRQGSQDKKICNRRYLACFHGNNWILKERNGVFFAVRTEI
jgi:hypothetical protein